MKTVVGIFWRFFLLGWVSFGGPMAHLSYFRQTFVEKLQWIDEAHYSRLIALSQFLPGPGSSQVGFAIGLARGGQPGAWAAFVGFTLPSFLILFAVALYQPPAEAGFYALVVAGLKLLAVVVVADATLGMFQSFCRTRVAQLTAVLTAAVLLLFSTAWMQLLVLALAFTIGWRFFAADETLPPTAPVNAPTQSNRWIWVLLGLVGGLIGANLLFPGMLPQILRLLADFMQAGALVFGGGHVVLPLLETVVGSQLTSDEFLSGYAMAQAIPGPMFTFATYLGTLLLPQAPLAGALLATLGLFLPGLLLVLALHHSWQAWSMRPAVQGGVGLLNAAVVGLLLATLFTPVFTSAVSAAADMAWVLIGFALLRLYRPHILWLVFGFGLLLPLMRSAT